MAFYNLQFRLFDGCLLYTDCDTIVDGFQYKILDGYHYTSRTFLFREDLIEKKVFLKKITHNEEVAFIT